MPLIIGMSKKPKAQEIGILLYQKIIEDYCNTVLTPKVERVTSICFFFSCIPAEPPVSSASRNISCTFYPQIAGVCGDIISNRYIFGDSGVLSRSESLIAKYEGFLALISGECKIFSKEVACRYAFPLCDTSLNKPLAQGVCRKTCEFVTYEKCLSELDYLRVIAAQDSDFDEIMLNCTSYPAANGGEAPECYQLPALPGDYLLFFLRLSGFNFLKETSLKISSLFFFFKGDETESTGL